jgi:subtilase family serine protease
MIYSKEITDLFENYEVIVNNLEPKYPEKMILHGEEVREFLAYKLMKLEAQIKNEG